MAATFASQSFTPVEIIASNFPQLTGPAVVVGAGLKRGAVLGRVTATGKLVLSASGSSDGSQVPFAILADDEIAAAEQKAAVYLAGHFEGSKLAYGTGHTADSVRDAFRAAGIFIK